MKHLIALFILGILISCSQTSSESSSTQPETIVNQKADELFARAQIEGNKGVFEWAGALDLYNQANELEPENPIILHARARLKIMSEIDIDGGFEDHSAAIEFSKDDWGLRCRYQDRALDFLNIGDICSACEDWKKVGDAQNYLTKYCKREFTNDLKGNNDERISVEIVLEDSISFMKSGKKTGGMTPVMANLIVKNISFPELIIKGGLLDFGHEVGSMTSLFLEAVDSDENKFHFFKANTYSSTSSSPNHTLKAGSELNKRMDIFHLHHFAYPGTYKVRVGLRPSKNVRGLENTYYSNWVTVTIFRK
ncbi:MAG: hypothetical protein GQ574_12970 [Crocinitomix sp.]|nr:hypothetical protein [Crocinitomix sp.]